MFFVIIHTLSRRKIHCCLQNEKKNTSFVKVLDNQLFSEHSHYFLEKKNILFSLPNCVNILWLRRNSLFKDLERFVYHAVDASLFDLLFINVKINTIKK